MAQGVVVGVADRMVTAGDIEYEPQSTKIRRITDSIIVMIAGEISVHAEAEGRLLVSTRKGDVTQTVRGVAHAYLDALRAIRHERASAYLLRHPEDKEGRDDLSHLIPEYAPDYEDPEFDALVVGIDHYPRGRLSPHIYEIRQTTLRCLDHQGYAAVGIGDWHARSRLMLSGHTPNATLQDAVVAAFTAKKRAEVAPGVGAATDVFTVGPSRKPFARFPDHWVEILDSAYEDSEARARVAMKEAREELDGYLDDLIQSAVDEALDEDE